VFRSLNANGASALEALLASRIFQKFIQSGELVGTRVATGLPRELVTENVPALVVEHDVIPFASYPYEWPPDMLHAAGVLTLALARAAVDEHLILKDATPYNVLFRGPQPVFVDVMSFERRDPGDPLWRAGAQLERTFLLPLLASKYLGHSIASSLMARRDGLEPMEMYRHLGPIRRLCPPFLGLVTVPTWLTAKAPHASAGRRGTPVDPDRATFILAALIRRQERRLEALKPRLVQSSWSSYSECNSYSAEESAAKARFVAEAVAEFKPRRVLDVGSNTGTFSLIAARGGASVVAIDSDEVVVGRLWRHARAENLDILPLVVDFARPTPAIGWWNSECDGFLDRAHLAFDAVFMLAVLHHLLVSERVPMNEIARLLATLTRDLLIVEFVGTSDPMFRIIARGREELYTDLSETSFELTVSAEFDILRRAPVVPGRRSLYLLRRKQ
jgi:SAM-dependent methyltransferase